MLEFYHNNADIEKGIAEYCGLIHNPAYHGVDAHDADGNAFEIKYAAKGTAFSVNAGNISAASFEKWRGRYWIGVLGRESSGIRFPC